MTSVTCAFCGDETDGPRPTPAGAHEAFGPGPLCSTCAYWATATAGHGAERALVADGHYYVIGNEATRGVRGFSGDRFRFRLHDGREIESTNVWNGSLIPDRYRALLPDDGTRLDTRRAA